MYHTRKTIQFLLFSLDIPHESCLVALFQTNAWHSRWSDGLVATAGEASNERKTSSTLRCNQISNLIIIKKRVWCVCAYSILSRLDETTTSGILHPSSSVSSGQSKFRTCRSFSNAIPEIWWCPETCSFPVVDTEIFLSTPKTTTKLHRQKQSRRILDIDRNRHTKKKPLSPFNSFLVGNTSFFFDFRHVWHVDIRMREK